MAGFKQAISAFAVTLQPTPGTYNEPNSTTDLVPVQEPDNGSDAITGDDSTVNGSLWGQPRQFLGRRGRAGATAVLRGPGGATPFAAGAWPIGRILQAVGFTELINPTAILGQAQANNAKAKAILAAAASGIDDFYMGMPFTHANLGAVGSIRGTSLIRDYDGASKTVTMLEAAGQAITDGQYQIPPSVSYILSTGLNIPLLSVKVWRHKKAYRYRDCAINSFAINVPVSNDQNTDFPTIEFAMVGVPVASTDETSPIVPSSILLPPPPAKAGKFVFNNLKLGHQTMRVEFGLETGAPPNQNFDAGQEAYEIMSGTRTLNLDLNENLVATLDLDSLVDTQAAVPTLSGWGTSVGNRFLLGVMNSYLDPFNPAGRNGFVGVSGTGSPADVDRAISLSLLY